MDPANKSDQNQPTTGVSPVDTSYGDGATNPIPTIPSPTPVVEEVSTTTTTTSSLPAAAPVDATAGNQPTVAVTPPPPSNGQTVTSFKPTRGKFTSTGIIATIFGILVLVAATVVGITQVGQIQVFQQKAACISCGGGTCPDGWSYGPDSCAPQSDCGQRDAEACANHQAGPSPNQCSAWTCGSNSLNNCSTQNTFNATWCDGQGRWKWEAAGNTSSCGGNASKLKSQGCGTSATTAPTTPPGGNNSGGTTCSPSSVIDTGGGNTTSAYCNHSSFAFNTCPDPICATATQTCAQIAQGLGCYRTGGLACGFFADNTSNGVATSHGCSSGSCVKTGSTSTTTVPVNINGPEITTGYCSGSLGTGTCTEWKRFSCPNNFTGDNCTQNGTGVSGPDQFISPFCGSQQIDCATGGAGHVGLVSTSGCQPGQAPSAPPATNPPGGTNPPSGPSAQCLNVKAYDTNWNQLTAQQLSALQSGSVVRLAIKGSATSGSFNKARFTVNAVLRPETTTVNPADPQQFYDDYTIPAGVTNFTIKGEVHHQGLNQWEG